MKYRVISALLLGMVILSTTAAEVHAAQLQMNQADVSELKESEVTAERIHALNSGSSQDSVLMCGGVKEYLQGIGSGEAVVEEPAAEPIVSEPVSEYADLAIAKVSNYVNVRAAANTESDIVGKIYNGAVAHVQEVTEGQDGEWFKIISGSVEGYIKSEFFLYGDAAAEVIDDYVTRYAMVRADRLNVREAANLEAKRIGFVMNGERIQLLEDNGDWLKVQYTDEKTGFVAAEYVVVSEEFVYAKTLAEEAAELAARRELEERQRVSESQAAENTTMNITPPSGDYTEVSETRNAVIEYAKQFLGNKYVNGGRSLVTGTDCSGFTSLIYAEFGYSLGRTPGGQFADAGRSVDYSEAQPGDIVCYGKNGKCTHVALYMGGGQIIHSANSRKGVITAGVDIEPILGFKRIIE